jgi:hypothetical protein
LRIGTETSGLRLLEEAAFTKDSKLAAQFWNVQRIALVGGARPPGSSFILEDVCFRRTARRRRADLAALFAA